MDGIKVKVAAKVNITLDVTGRLGSYHALDSVFASVDLYDTVTVAKSNSDNIYMNGDIRAENNIAYRTLKSLQTECGAGNYTICIDKKIPFNAGMGGSSADCSACLYAIGKLENISEKHLMDIAAKLGSDTVFMYSGGAMRARGKGESLEKLYLPDFYCVYCVADGGAGTKEVFSQFDTAPVQSNHTEIFLKAISVTPRNAFKHAGNALYAAASVINKNISECYGYVSGVADAVSMTGSGSAVIAYADSLELAKIYLGKIKCRYPNSGIARHVKQGIIEIQ